MMDNDNIETPFFKSPFDCIKLAALNDGMAADADISAKSSGLIIKFINKHRAESNLEVHVAPKESEARDLLLKLVRDGDLVESHPVFHNWPKVTGGLKTAFATDTLLSRAAQIKKLYRTSTDPEKAWLEVAATHVSSCNEVSETAVIAGNSTIGSQNTNTPVNPIPKTLRTPHARHSKGRKSSKTPILLNRRSPSAGSLGSNPHHNLEFAEMLTSVNANLLKEFKEHLNSEITSVYTTLEKTKNVFTADLDEKASKNYVRQEMNRMNTKVDEMKNGLSADIAAIPIQNGHSSSSVHTKNSPEFVALAAKVEECERVIALLKSKVIPEQTDEYLATQIDRHQMARSRFLFAINGQKRAGCIYIGVPTGLFRQTDNKFTEIFIDKIASILGINFEVISKINVNFSKTRASCKIKLRNIQTGDMCLKKIDEIIASRQTVQQNHDITIQVATVAEYHFGHTLRSWINKKIIFNFENTTSGQYRIFIGDGQDHLTTAKARNRSCSSFLIDNPIGVFNMRHPTIDNLLKIKSGNYFVSDSGELLEVPVKFMWMFESYESRTTRLANSVNINPHTADTDAHPAVLASIPKPAVLSTTPLVNVANKFANPPASLNHFTSNHTQHTNQAKQHELPGRSLPPHQVMPTGDSNNVVFNKQNFDMLANLLLTNMQTHQNASNLIPSQ